MLIGMGAMSMEGEHGTGSQTLDGTFREYVFGREEMVPFVLFNVRICSPIVACFASDIIR